MAIGNIGNLLQHFVALRVAQKLVQNWRQADIPIEYIDCYSMAPWEEITGGQPQGFVELVNRFPAMRNQGDLVSTTFLQAWQNHYNLREMPPHPQQRDYPNTAVLLCIGFPEQAWRMRLHENNLIVKGNNAALSNWARSQANGSYEVAGDWTQSSLICNSPAPTDRPVFVMLDPFQIVLDNSDAANNDGYLPERLLRFLVGDLALRVRKRLANEETAPFVMTLFSYADRTPDVTERIVLRQFAGEHWQVESVRSGPWQGRNRQNWHVGWIVSTGLPFPLLGQPAQDEWNLWVNGGGN